MTWLQIVLWALTNAPTLIGDIKKIIDLIHALPINHPAAQNVNALLSSAIATGNRETVKAALAECQGVACPTELKQD